MGVSAPHVPPTQARAAGTGSSQANSSSTGLPSPRSISPRMAVLPVVLDAAYATVMWDLLTAEERDLIEEARRLVLERYG